MRASPRASRALAERAHAARVQWGRCLSATHEAAACVRIMPICTAMGQAAGEAAAMAVSDGRAAAEVDVDELRARLREAGAFLG